MSEGRTRYKPRAKRRSMMPFVLVGIVIAVGVAGFLILKNKPEKMLPERAEEEGVEGPNVTPNESDPSSPSRIVAGIEGKARHAVEVPPAATGESLPKDRLYEIFVPPDAEALWVRGKACDLRGLSKELRLVGDMDREMTHPLQPSRKGVVIRADASTRFREIQWVMQVCAHPDVAIYRIHWAVKGGEGGEGGEAVLPVFLPIDRGITTDDARIQAKVEEMPVDLLEDEIKPDIDEIPPIEMEDEVIEDTPFEGLREEVVIDGDRITERIQVDIRLRRAAGDPSTRIMLFDASLGLNVFERLAKDLKSIGKKAPKLPCQIDASAEVPFGDVVKALDAARAAGFRNITFTGAPMPGR